MDLLDYLSYDPSHSEFIDTLIMLFGPDEILTAISYGNVIMENLTIRLNIQ